MESNTETFKKLCSTFKDAIACHNFNGRLSKFEFRRAYIFAQTLNLFLIFLCGRFLAWAILSFASSLAALIGFALTLVAILCLSYLGFCALVKRAHDLNYAVGHVAIVLGICWLLVMIFGSSFAFEGFMDGIAFCVIVGFIGCFINGQSVPNAYGEPSE